MGELPEYLKIEHEEKKIEACIQKYIQKDPNDQLAFMKGLVEANKTKFLKFIFVRIML